MLLEPESELEPVKKKYPEPVKNEPAPQHWWSNVFFSTTDMR